MKWENGHPPAPVNFLNIVSGFNYPLTGVRSVRKWDNSHLRGEQQSAPTHQLAPPPSQASKGLGTPIA